MRITVWVDDWQMQCCGTPFAIGDQITWMLSSSTDSDWLSGIFGPQQAHRITHAEDHHGQQDVVDTFGRVVDIAAAFCSYTELPDGRGTAFHRVPGSGELHPVTEADDWDSAPEGRSFLGYIVEFEAYDDLVARR